jgi:Ca2+-binding RTX toxin-like protein
MRKLIRVEKSGPVRLAAAAVAVAAAVGTAGIVTANGHAAPAHNTGKTSQLRKANEFKPPTLEQGLLTVEGTNGNDVIALRLQAGNPGILQVDVGDDGSADFSFARADVTRIAVDAGNGDDFVRIDESNGVFSDTIPTTIDGGNGNDKLVGGSGAVTLQGGNGDDELIGGNGAETLSGGNGNDTIDGNRGNDVAVMGNGDDTFVWDPGDGSDTVEGQNGNDTMVFNGANVAEKVDLSANGRRLRFFRDVANITMDTAGVETIDFNALGGADTVTVNDLTGTDVRNVNVDLAGALGGTAGDGANDRVIVNGTNGNDSVAVTGDAGGVQVTDLAATVGIVHAEAANDRLDVDTLPGSDTVSSAGLAKNVIQLFVNGALVP